MGECDCETGSHMGVPGPGYYPRKILETLYAKPCILGNIKLCDNWSTNWDHFAELNTDVKAFLNQLLLDSHGATKLAAK